MEETPQELLPETAPVRPMMLTVLCILTFIGSGLNLFSSVVISLFFEPFKLAAASISETLELPGIEAILGADRLFFVVSAAVYALSIFGAYNMFRLKRIGFHLYTIAQILLIIVPMYFFHLPGPSIVDLMLSGAFVIFYATHLKIMKA